MVFREYNPHKKELDGKPFYCGSNLNQLADILDLYGRGSMTMQEAYDSIVNDIIIKHVIKNSDCECKVYLHEIEENLQGFIDEQ